MSDLVSLLRDNPLLWISIQVILIFAIALLLSPLGRSGAYRHALLKIGLSAGVFVPLMVGVCWKTGWEIRLPVLASTSSVNQDPSIPSQLNRRKPENFERPEQGVAEPSNRSQNDPSNEGTASFVMPENEQETDSIGRRESEIQTGNEPIAVETNGDDAGEKQPSNGERLSFASIVFAIWSAACIALLLGLIRSIRAVWRIARSSTALQDGELESAKKRATAILGIDRFPTIAVSRDVCLPAAVGLGPWERILIPVGFVDDLDRRHLEQVLVHEAAHLIRRDPLTQIFARVVIALWWWCPLVWMLNRKLSQASEEACDDYVLKNFEPTEYGTTLLMLGKLMEKGHPAVGMVGLFGTRWNLERRIQGILDPKRKKMTSVNKRSIVFVAGLFAALTVVSSVTRLSGQDADDKPLAVGVRLPSPDRGDVMRGIRARNELLKKLVVARDYLQEMGLPELVKESEGRIRVVELELRDLQQRMMITDAQNVAVGHKYEAGERVVAGQNIPGETVVLGHKLADNVVIGHNLERDIVAIGHNLDEEKEVTHKVLRQLEKEFKNAKTDAERKELEFYLMVVGDSIAKGYNGSWKNIIDASSVSSDSDEEKSSSYFGDNGPADFQKEMRDTIKSLSVAVEALQQEVKQLRDDHDHTSGH
ncbi:MAG: M56 family metallopeptidase [Planctomycetota bacterium]